MGVLALWFLQPRRNVPLGMQHTPILNMTVPLDMEDPVRIALQQLAAQAGKIKLMSGSERACRRMTADRSMSGFHGIDEAKGDRLAGFYCV
ncbi:MAG: hypothetical protein JWQ29_776 [Phenylobacterium sp.]|nr:hypothetical protein [Phenylobacterium sp.]